MTDTKKPYDLLVAREYTKADGEVKTRYYVAGVAFQNTKGGFNIEVVDGLAITGKAIILPRREKAEDDGTSYE